MAVYKFLSTLSLRRATPADLQIRVAPNISIHALLAESDAYRVQLGSMVSEFLSTLSLRRATGAGVSPGMGWAQISIHALLAESDD